MAAEAPHTRMLRRRKVWALLCLTLLLGVIPGVAAAQIGSARYSSIVVDNGSGRVMEEVNADALALPGEPDQADDPLYGVRGAARPSGDLDAGGARSRRGPRRWEPSKLGLVPGTYFTVSDAILAIVTKSANDAACALGELLGGDEDRFAQMMTLRRARAGHDPDHVPQRPPACRTRSR